MPDGVRTGERGPGGEAAVVRVRFAPASSLVPAGTCPDYSMARPVAGAGDHQQPVNARLDVAPAQRVDGRGKFLIKVDESPGVPVDMTFTATEYDLGVHDTNKRIRRPENGVTR